MNRGFTYYIKDKINKDLVYYGSSEMPTVEDRMKIHLNNFNRWKKNNDNGYCSSFKILELSNYEYDTIEVVYFDTKYELRQCERLLIEGQVCVNIEIPNRTDKEYRVDNKVKIKEQNKQYRVDNKEKFKERNKQYRVDNKEKIKEKDKQYYIENQEKIKEQNKQYKIDNKDKIAEQNKQYKIDNKEKIKEYKKQYWVDNREKLKQKITCECGCVILKGNITRHYKSNKHLKLIS